MAAERKKIAVIGGGVGAMTAAYAITQIPGWDQTYELTVYQLGWRCGGKGASGRNTAQHDRIEEHGLHIWAGFYENAFRLMRDCYDTLNSTGLRSPDAPLGTLDKAFKGLSHFLLAEDLPQPDGTVSLHPWRVDFPPNDEKPGTGGVLPTPFAYFQMLARSIADLCEQSLSGSATTAQNLPDRFHYGFNLLGLPLTAASPFHHLSALAARLSDNPHNHKTQETMLLAALAAHAQDWHDARPATTGDEARRIGYMISLSAAFFRGAIDSGLFRAGFDAIDNWEISAWLLHYGASQESVYSAVFKGCYDYVFGYPGGVTEDRGVGAGTAIRGLLRLAFTYKGALFYKMQAGMGDTIFGPYYQVLKSRGVTFRFFTAARALHLDQDKIGVSAIDMVEQAQVIGGDYEPLVDVRGLPCWPSRPDLTQLTPGTYTPGIDFECEKDPPTGRPFRLERGRDFDQVILGASLGSIPYLAEELIAASQRWRAMVQNVGTVATHAAQFWLNKSAKDLGWNALVAQHNPGPQTDLKTVITSFTEPLDTWADMSDLIPHEGWPDADPPAQLAYFCSPAHNVGVDPAPFKTQVRDWADRDLIRMWPGAAKDGKFDMSLLWGPKDQPPEDRFETQYFRQNYYRSERYVLSVPNSVQYRLPPDDSGFENLFLAGDWTRCGINAGCVEAATISGLVCARGLTGYAFEVVGESDLLPDTGPTDRAQLASPYAQTAPWPLTSFFGTGAVDGWFSFHAVDAAALQAVLPKGMTLAPQAFTPAGTHPITILANQQFGVRPSALPRFLGFRDYLEAIISVACVQVDGHPGLFNYLPNLYLSNRMAQLAGVWFYGFYKRMGKLAMENSTYSVATPDGTPVWSAQYQNRGFARSLFDSPDASRVQTLCDQVIVSRCKSGRWHFSSFDFSLGTAEITPVNAEIEITDSALAQLPAGRMVAHPLAMDGDGLHHPQGLPGAFRIRTSWTLSNPLDSGRIARLEAARTRLP